MQGGQPVVAGLGAVASGDFQVRQKGRDYLVVDVLDSELIDGFAQTLTGEAQKELQSVPVTDNGIGTQPPLSGEVAVEKSLDITGDQVGGVHGASPFGKMFWRKFAKKRSWACSSNSAVARR